MSRNLRFIFIIILALLSTNASAQTVYRLEGTIGGQYPIVIELEEDDDGFISGRYAYKSTLRKNGDVECSWLMINPSYANPETQWTIRDCKPDVVEEWSNVNFDDRKHLTARMKNTRGKSYAVTATVTSQGSNENLTPYFKQHIGETVYDMDMFNYLPVKSRLIALMGNTSYSFLKKIYQTQGDIEYSKGMFYGSGFMAHQCCDPATVWAYDTHSNSFYIWIRKDGKDYWWSETGDIPIKFREIVCERF
ncbi:MAG: hypothetical protein ACI306_04095 [Muribaculaceae bacterium]